MCLELFINAEINLRGNPNTAIHRLVNLTESNGLPHCYIN